MIEYHVYPGGKKRIVTFSYDDGSSKDARLIEIFDKYGVKGTFHINGKKLFGKSEEELSAFRDRYKGHEVSCHTLLHGWPSRMPPASLVQETVEDRRILEGLFGMPIIGMSYPSGSYNEEVISTLAACGIVYSRTTKSTETFALPECFLEWHPTCHHNDAQSLIPEFLQNLDNQWRNPLFYIWGHSHELKTEEDWQMMEEIVCSLANNDKIWYATNMDIYNYMTAQRQLQISYDETLFYNPTAIDVWVEKNKTDILCIPAGQTLSL